jgi:diguanylate cyclase (GGDEF)-like protein
MPRWMNSIHLRLIILFMVVTTTTLGCFAFYEQQLLAKELESRFETGKNDVLANLQQNLAEPLWALDLSLVDAKLEAAMHSQEVSAAILTSPDNTEIYSGIVRETSGKPVLKKTFNATAETKVEVSIYPPPQLDDERRKISIGKLTVHFSRDQINKALRVSLVRNVAEVIAMNLLLLLVLTLSLQIIFRPLKELGDGLRSLASEHGDDVKELPKTQRVELDELIDGFNLTLRKLKQIILRHAQAEATARDAVAATEHAYEQVKAAQLELIEKNKLLEELSVTDTLTRLNNRLKLDQVLASEIHRHLRYGNVFALIMLDIDHFKAINDNHGHPVGDQVLVELAGLLIAETRKVDCVGRWGGEEFLIICPDTHLEGAVEFAEKLRQSIADHPFPAIGQATASFGVCSARPGESVHQMVTRADEALYRSKNNGRNRVEKSD